jgi:glycosyltransferase involved in cell wall biosynthesis
MKICIIALRAYQLFNKNISSPSGGAEMQLYLLARELQKSGFSDIHFIVADYGQQKVEEYNQIRLWKSFRFDQNLFSRMFRFFSIFRKVNADVHIQRTLTVFSGIIALFCRLTGKKFIYMVAHDGETDQTLDIFKNKFNRIFIRLLFRHASLVIVQNQYEQENLKKKYPGIKTEILKKGIEIQYHEQHNEPLFDCIWIGRCEKWKNPHMFIELAEKNPTLKFLMILFPAETEQELYDSMISKGAQLRNLTMHAYISPSQINDFLLKSSVFCFTSELEGDWPMVVLEACRCSLPVISYKLNYGLLIDEYKGGVFCNGSIDEMSEQIGKLSRNIELLSSMSKNAFKFVSENHDIKEQADQFKKIIMQFSKQG